MNLINSVDLHGRAAFGVRQAQMTERWYESVKRSHKDVGKYIASRQDAYLGRWREAARFFPSKPKVLDVGGGNLFDRLMEFFIEHELDYWYQDVDPAAVDGAKNLANRFGLDSSKLIEAFNDYYPYSDGFFDVVFSSHCIEHSIDLVQTLSEINRILRAGGMFTMAVPLGWEANPEHPFFFDQEHWLLLLEDFGFEVRVAQIGREYPESGIDLFIAARKVASPTAPRIDINDFTKSQYEFVKFDDSRIIFSGNHHQIDDNQALKLVGIDWIISLSFKGATHVVPIFHRHPWSGIIKVETKYNFFTEDLFSWTPSIQPFSIAIDDTVDIIRITSASKNIASRGTEAILCGVMYR